MTKKNVGRSVVMDPNIDRAEALPVWPGCRDEFMVVLSVTSEEVADGKGRIIAVYRDGQHGLRRGEAGKVATRAARNINTAIRNAVRCAVRKAVSQ